MKLMRWLRLTWRWIVRRRLIASAVAVSILLLVVYWKWFVTVTPCRESGSTTIRNLGLVAGGLFALWFAYRRSVVADRQARSSQDQAKAALHQAETSQRGLLNERYQKGAEMIGSEILAVRLGGIYALQRLAADELEQYHVQIMLVLSAFVRNPTQDQEANATPPASVLGLSIKDYGLREDVQAALTVICRRSAAAIELEKANYRLVLTLADLTGAVFSGANLTGAHLTLTNLSGAFLSRAKGLTQAQLDEACADPGNPPDLGDLCDAKTGAPSTMSPK